MTGNREVPMPSAVDLIIGAGSVLTAGAELIEDVFLDARDDDGLTAAEVVDHLDEVGLLLTRAARMKVWADRPVARCLLSAAGAAAYAVQTELRQEMTNGEP